MPLNLLEKNKIAADKGAVDPMRRELNKINMTGTVVIGEGEMDEAPNVILRKLGTLNGPEFDIAVDPLEGTKFTANGQPTYLCFSSFRKLFIISS